MMHGADVGTIHSALARAAPLHTRIAELEACCVLRMFTRLIPCPKIHKYSIMLQTVMGESSLDMEHRQKHGATVSNLRIN